MNWDDEAEFEPLGEYERDWARRAVGEGVKSRPRAGCGIDRLKLLEGPRGCHWIGDDAQHCNKPLARLPSRSPYCEEHLRRRLQEARSMWIGR